MATIKPEGAKQPNRIPGEECYMGEPPKGLKLVDDAKPFTMAYYIPLIPPTPDIPPGKPRPTRLLDMDAES